MKVYIMRHGQTDWNRLNKLQGGCDIPLNEQGEELAVITANGFLKDGISFDHIFTSPLVRAARTARIVRDIVCPDTQIVTDSRLREMSFGEYEGVPKNAVPDDFRKFFNDPVNYVPSKGGESFPHAIVRSGKFLRNVILPLSAKEPDATVLIAGHGGIDETLIMQLSGKGIESIWTGPFKHNCCVICFEVTPDSSELYRDVFYYYDVSGQENGYTKKEE